MAAKIMGLVWELELTPAKQTVLLALADHADHEGGSVHPGVPLIAWKTGYSERQVRRIMHDLEADGLLITVQSRDGKPTIYRIDLSKGIRKAPFQTRKERAAAQPTPDKMSAPTPDILSDGQNVPLTSHGEDETLTPDIASAKTSSIHQKINHQEKTKSAERARAKPEYGFQVDFSSVEGAGGSIAYETGELIPTPQRGQLAQSAIAIFNAYLGVLRELGRAPIGGDEALWRKHQPAALALALARETPESVERYMVEQYLGSDTFWPSRPHTMPLRHIAENIRSARARTVVALNANGNGNPAASARASPSPPSAPSTSAGAPTLRPVRREPAKSGS